MAFAEDLLEIRLVANGSLVHAACIPGLKLLCGRRVSTYNRSEGVLIILLFLNLDFTTACFQIPRIRFSVH